MPSIPGFKVTSPKPRGNDLQTVCDAIDSTTKRWKVADLRLCLSEAEVEAITLIPIALNHIPDSLIWHFDSKGIYSVQSGYHIAMKDLSTSLSSNLSSSFQPPRAMWKMIWDLKLPPKLKHFWWRVCKNVLATKENLCKRRCVVSNLCPFCQNSPETAEHLLFGCDWVRAIWFGCDLKLDGQGGPVASIPHWVCDMMNFFRMNSEMSSFFSLIIWIGWFI